MKKSAFIIIFQLLLVAAPAYAESSEDEPATELLPLAHETSAQPQMPKDTVTIPREGDAIWLEEKIARPTRWIENLVKPLTAWMEGKVQRSGAAMDADQASPLFPAPIQSPDREAGLNSATRTPREASELARQQVPGDVLMAKLLSTDQGELYYRVKLISDIGEIHIFYINDRTGEMMRAGKPSDASQGQEGI